jgi:hypothetical protein
MPAAGGGKPTEPQERVPNLFEKLYGANPDDVKDESDPNFSLDNMTEDYLDKRNLDLSKEGFSSGIRQVMEAIHGAKNRQSARR